MNKTGIVVQVNKKIACLMTSDGQFINVKTKDKIPSLGEIYSGEVYKKTPMYRLPAIAALLSFFILLSGGMYTYYAPAAELTVSINPSVKITLNRWNRIIKSIPLNDDGEKILSSLKLNNMTLDNGLNMIVEQAKEDNFINEAYMESGRIISVHINSNSSSNLDLTKFQQSIENQSIGIEIIDDSNLEDSSKVKSPKENEIDKNKEIKEDTSAEEKPQVDSKNEVNDKETDKQNKKVNKSNNKESNNDNKGNTKNDKNNEITNSNLNPTSSDSDNNGTNSSSKNKKDKDDKNNNKNKD